MLKLSALVTTCDRPNLLRACLSALQVAKIEARNAGLSVEIIVVDESVTHPRNQDSEAEQIADQYLLAPKRGYWGAFAKDDGIQAATGDFICFCDDDNIFYPHCFLSYAESVKRDSLGVVPVYWMSPSGGCSVLPQNWSGHFQKANVDTANFCVRTVLARKHRWSETIQDRTTDYHWIIRVAADTACRNVNFLCCSPVATVVPWSSYPCN